MVERNSIKIDLEVIAKKTKGLLQLNKEIDALKKKLEKAPREVKSAQSPLGFDDKLLRGLKRRFGDLNRLTGKEKDNWRDVAKNADDAIRKMAGYSRSLNAQGRALKANKRINWEAGAENLHMIRRLEHAVGKFHEEWLDGGKRVQRMQSQAAKLSEQIENRQDRLRRKMAAEREREQEKADRLSGKSIKEAIKGEEYKASSVRKTNSLYERQRKLKAALANVSALRKQAKADKNDSRASRLLKIENRLRDQMIANGNAIHKAETKRHDEKIRNAQRAEDILFRMALASNANFDKIQRARVKIHQRHQAEIGRAQKSVADHFHGAGGGVKQAANALTNPFFESPVYYMTAAGAAAGAAMAVSFAKHMAVDLSTTKMKMFGEMSQADVNEMRRGGMDREISKYGLKPEMGFQIATEALKAGVDQKAIGEFLPRIMQFTHSLDILDPNEVTKVAATAGLRGSKNGIFDAEAMARVNESLTSAAIAAMESRMDPNEIISGGRRGAGAMSYGLSPKMFYGMLGAAGQGGLQAERAGTMLEVMTQEMTNAANFQNTKMVKGRRMADDDEGGRMARFGAQMGWIKNRKDGKYTAKDLETVQARFRKDKDGSWREIFERAKGMDENQLAELTNNLGGRQWSGELGTMLRYPGMLDKILAEIEKDPEGKRLKDLSDQRRNSLDGLWKSFKSNIEFMLDDLGSGMDGLFVKIVKRFNEWSENYRDLRLGERLNAAIEGTLSGLGINIDQTLDKWLSKGRTTDDTIKGIRSFFEGFGQGFMAAFGPLIAVVRKVTGDFDPQKTGDMIGKLVGFLLVLKILRPFVGLGFMFVGLTKTVIHFGLLLAGIAKLGGLAAAVRSLPRLAATTMAAGSKAGAFSRGVVAIAGAFMFMPRLIGRALSRMGVGTVAGSMGAFAGRILGMVGRFFSVLFWAWLGKKIAEAIYNNWDSIKPVVKTALTSFWNAFMDAFKDMILEVFMVKEFMWLRDKLHEQTGTPKTINPDGSDKPRAFPMFLYPDFWKSKTDPLNGSSGSNALGGSPGSDLIYSRDIGYQASQDRHLAQINANMDRLVDAMTWQSLQDRVNAARSGGQGGYGRSGANGHLMRPGMFGGGSSGVGGSGGRFGGSGGASRGGADSGGGTSGTGNGSLSQSGALAEASKYLGMNEYKNVGQLKSFMNGWDPRGDAQAWCAQFMNASLQSQGIKGTGSALASSFLNWGVPVLDAGMAKAGDVLVQHRGRRPGQSGSHVGMFTGNTRQGKNGLEMEMLGGNQGDGAGGGVTKQWVAASKLAIRRANVGERAAQAAQGAAQAASDAFQAPANAANLPAGLRNNNPGNLKYSAASASKYGGVVGPSSNTDQGDHQIKFRTMEDGLKGMSDLIGRKFGSGKDTVNKMIAEKMGWTPGNYQAAANIARTMGVGVNDKLDLNNAAVKKSFMKALMLQEHGPSSKMIMDDQINRALGISPSGASSNVLSPRVPTMQGDRTQIPNNMAGAVPQPHAVQMASLSGGGGGNTYNGGSPQISISIQGGNQDPAAIAQQVQRHINQNFQRRVHDIEPDTA